MWIAEHGILESGNKNTLLLDSITGIQAAFSVRKLRSSYSGNCIRVRRSSDNTEQDIGFASNALDESALAAFVGSSNGFIVTWYDQSGNGNNATTLSTGGQPRIINAGTIDKQNSKPSLFFNGTSNFFQIQSTFADLFEPTVTPISIFASATYNNLTSGMLFALSGNENSTDAFNDLFTFSINATSEIRGVIRNFTPPSTFVEKEVKSASAITSTFRLLSWIRSTTTGTIYVNGSAGTSLDQAFSDAFTFFWANIGVLKRGSTGSLAAYFSGYLSEIIIGNTNQTSNRTFIQSNINSYYTIY